MKTLTLTLLSVVSLLISPSTLATAKQDQFLNPCDSRECRVQFKKVRKYAKNGSPDAKGILAAMYLSGYGTEIDEKKGVKWLRQAAKTGSHYYRLKLGMLYLNGEVVDKDVRKGLKLIESSAEQGIAPANYLLGAMYVKGTYFDKDLTKAAGYLNAAAAKGSANATYLLATLYEEGAYGAAAIDHAPGLYQVAAKAGHAKARERLLALGKAKPGQFDHDEDIEHITVRAPDTSELLDNAISMIQNKGLFNSRGTTGSRLPGRSCVVDKSCRVIDDINIIGKMVYNQMIRMGRVPDHIKGA